MAMVFDTKEDRGLMFFGRISFYADYMCHLLPTYGLTKNEQGSYSRFPYNKDDKPKQLYNQPLPAPLPPRVPSSSVSAIYEPAAIITTQDPVAEIVIESLDEPGV